MTMYNSNNDAIENYVKYKKMFRHIMGQIRCEGKCVNGPENENIMQHDFLFYFMVLQSLKLACFCEIYAKSLCNSKKKKLMMEI